MKFTYTLSTLLLGSILLTGGCSQLENFDDELDKKNAELTKELGGTPVDEEDTAAQTNNQEQFASVQDYTGEGFKLPNSGDLTAKLAAENKEEITHAVKNFFKSSYKTEVTVHNMAGARDGISVFVESVGEPHFHTFAIVPVNFSEKKVLTKKVTSLENEIEMSIESGIYAMVFKDEILELEKYLEQITTQYPVMGLRIEAIQNTFTGGYAKPGYFISTLDPSIKELGRQYAKDPVVFKEKINSIKKPSVNPDILSVGIHLYMKDENVQPNPEVFNKIVAGLKGNNTFPPGTYNVYLHTNKIDKSSGGKDTDNSLQTMDGDIIIK